MSEDYDYFDEHQPLLHNKPQGTDVLIHKIYDIMEKSRHDVCYDINTINSAAIIYVKDDNVLKVRFLEQDIDCCANGRKEIMHGIKEVIKKNIPRNLGYKYKLNWDKEFKKIPKTDGVECCILWLKVTMGSDSKLGKLRHKCTIL